ncbi:MAG: hypothetical protein OEV92_02420 [Nitrospinota bacterium]|nr:hypothetical protein [Nitrospinota bacterium]
MEKALKIAVIVIFIMSLLIADAQMSFDLFKAPTLLEKRKLAIFPERISMRFPDEFDTYMNDNFGFRKHFIRLNNLIDVKIFKTPPPGVILGNDDFLFMGCDWDSFIHRHSRYQDNELFEAALRIRKFQDKLKSRGIEFLLVIAPNKGTIYPEYIPKMRFTLQARSERERWNENLGKAGVNYLDVAPTLLEAKKRRLLYYKGDHHWNWYGGLIVSRQITSFLAGALGRKTPEFMVTSSIPDNWEATGGGSIDELLGVRTIRSNEKPAVEIVGEKLPPGILMGDSFRDWLYLDMVSDSLATISRQFSGTQLEAKQTKEAMVKALNDKRIRYFAAIYWEANQTNLLLDEQWEFDI